MVQYGKKIVKAQRSGWEEAYLDYKQLKQIICKIEDALVEADCTELLGGGDNSDKRAQQLQRLGVPGSSSSEESSQHYGGIYHSTPATVDPSPSLNLLKAIFFRDLRREIEKISLFVMKQQGKLSSAIGALRFENGTLFDSNETTVGRRSLASVNKLEEYSSLGVEMIHIFRFLSINAIGIQKILKKYNKAFESF